MCVLTIILVIHGREITKTRPQSLKLYWKCEIWTKNSLQILKMEVKMKEIFSHIQENVFQTSRDTSYVYYHFYGLPALLVDAYLHTQREQA